MQKAPVLPELHCFEREDYIIEGGRKSNYFGVKFELAIKFI